MSIKSRTSGQDKPVCNQGQFFSNRRNFHSVGEHIAISMAFLTVFTLLWNWQFWPKKTRRSSWLMLPLCFSRRDYFIMPIADDMYEYMPRRCRTTRHFGTHRDCGQFISISFCIYFFDWKCAWTKKFSVHRIGFCFRIYPCICFWAASWIGCLFDFLPHGVYCYISQWHDCFTHRVPHLLLLFYSFIAIWNSAEFSSYVNISNESNNNNINK